MARKPKAGEGMWHGLIIDPEPFMSGMEYGLYKKVDDAFISPTIALTTGLNRYPATWISAALRAHGIPMTGVKREKIEAIAERLRNPQKLSDLIDKLGIDEREILTKVLSQGGVVKYQSISRTYGDETPDSYFWDSMPPQSPIGRLREHGLIFVGRMQLGSRREKMLVVPLELRNPLSTILSADEAPTATSKAKTKASAKKATTEPASLVYELEVSLLEVTPRVWRQFTIPDSLTLSQLGRAIQIVMGWDGSHLYEFVVAGEHYSDPEADIGAENAIGVQLSDLSLKPGSAFEYIYDFGDDWHHRITVDNIRPIEPGETVPSILAGAQANPPEDIGGPYGYLEFLSIIADPKHPQHEEMLDWVEGSFDPTAFNLEQLQTELRTQARGGRWLKLPSKT